MKNGINNSEPYGRTILTSLILPAFITDIGAPDVRLSSIRERVKGALKLSSSLNYNNSPFHLLVFLWQKTVLSAEV